jgi:hypothetical protein
MLKAYDHRDVAICGCGTVGQMADNIRAVQKFRKMTLEESAEVRKRAVVGAGHGLVRTPRRGLGHTAGM